MPAVRFTRPADCRVAFGVFPGLVLDRAVAGTVAPALALQLG